LHYLKPYSMKTRILLLILVTGIFSSARGQNTIELTFIAFDSIAYVQLDSIKIMNRTQGGETVLYWPDTALSIYYVGMPEISKGNNSFQVFQNYPNPVADRQPFRCMFLKRIRSASP
jgi:hypothetical protein